MNRLMRMYFYGIFGAIGGLFSWHISNLLGLSFTKSLFLSELIIGGLLGLSIGLMIGIAEGIITKNPVSILRAGLISGGLGLLGGLIGLPVAEGIFQFAGGALLGRIIGWGILGFLIGLAVGITGGSQMWKGGLGGLLGGVLGGFLLEAARQLLSLPLYGKAAGLILLGLSIGLFIAMIVFMLSRAWLEVVSGKLKGTEFILDKFKTVNGPSAIIGSDALKSDIVFPDPDISPQHAMLQGTDTHFVLKDMSLSGTYINNRRIEEAKLSNGQKIRLGNTEFVYREKR